MLLRLTPRPPEVAIEPLREQDPSAQEAEPFELTEFPFGPYAERVPLHDPLAQESEPSELDELPRGPVAETERLQLPSAQETEPPDEVE